MSNIYSSAALAISIISLIISGLNAYYANFYVRRNVSVTIAPEPSGKAGSVKSTDHYYLTPIISNGGNRTEVVIRVVIAVGHSEPTIRQVRGDPAGPFVLKAGDAITVPVSFRYDKMFHLPEEQELYLRIIALHPREGIIAVDVPVSHIKLDQSSDRYLITETKSQKHVASIIDVFEARRSKFAYDGSPSATLLSFKFQVNPPNTR
jgi:hypothetical protein